MPTRAISPNAVLTALVLALAMPLATAADMTPSTPASNTLATARTLIAQKKWPEAIAELRRVN